jgi:predicted metalloprotease
MLSLWRGGEVHASYAGVISGGDFAAIVVGVVGGAVLITIALVLVIATSSLVCAGEETLWRNKKSTFHHCSTPAAETQNTPKWVLLLPPLSWPPLEVVARVC